jgi:acyl carrier protein
MTQNVDEIKNKVVKITSDKLNVDVEKISMDSNFVNDLGADSLDLVELIMDLEAAFECDISEKDAASITTIRQAVEYISNKISA